MGIFSLNFGPVLMGFVLDYLGPKFTSILGVMLNILGLILFSISSSSGVNAFIPASIILGLGNITFHLAQFHISALFPRKRGLITSAFVAGFTASGIIMYILLLIFESAGETRAAYRGVLLGFSGICALWIPLIVWMMPNDSFRVGTVFLLRKDWRFEVRLRTDMDRQYRRATALQDFVAAAQAAGGTDGAVAGTAAYMYGRELGDTRYDAANGSIRPNAGLIGGIVPDSSDPVWGTMDEAEEQRRQRQRMQQEQWSREINGSTGGSLNRRSVGNHSSSNENHHDSIAEVLPPATVDEGTNGVSPPPHDDPGSPQTLSGEGIGPESMPLPPDVVWGPLEFEARHFVELRKKSFKEQFLSSESFGMGLFYTLNIFFLQFYLGTQRLQLGSKGDDNNAYTDFGNVVVAFAFVPIPLIGWLLDRKGYGWTLGTINALAVLTSILQALPVLWIQAITLIIWMVARFFMYSSYFAIFGGLFGFKNFGRLVAIDNTFNGLFGLLQFPLTYLGIHALDGNFTLINIGQAVVLLPLFIFCYFMWRWEREDLVPIRPLEGEELPCDMVGQRQRKSLPHIELPSISIPHIEMPGITRRGRAYGEMQDTETGSA